MKVRSTRAVYAVAGIISLVLYAAGILTGINIQQSLSKTVEEDLASIKSDIENQQQELVLFSLRGKESCAVLQSLSASTAAKLDDVSGEIRGLGESGHKDARFNSMKETYSTLSIRAWILRTAINDNCGSQSLPILYYYSFPCSMCREQEEALEHIKSLDRERILTYAVDKDINSSLVQTLVRGHGIVTTPSLVVEDVVYKGFTDKTNLEKLVCTKIGLACPPSQNASAAATNETADSASTTALNSTNAG